MSEKNILLSDFFPTCKKSLGDTKLLSAKVFKASRELTISIEADTLSEEDRSYIEDLFSKKFSSFKKIHIEERQIKEKDLSKIIKSSIHQYLDIDEFSYLIFREAGLYRIQIFEECDELAIDKLQADMSDKGIAYDLDLSTCKQNKDEFIEDLKIESNNHAVSISKDNSKINKKSKKPIRKERSESGLVYRRKPKNLPERSFIKDLLADGSKVLLEGEIFKVDYFPLTSKKINIISIYFTDQTESSYTKVFIKNDQLDEYKDQLKVGKGISIYGEYTYDSYGKSDYIKPSYFELFDIQTRQDLSDEKRVELHLHTNMSSQDGLTSISDYIDRALYWGHEAIAITDHYSVQAFPEAMEASKGKDIKVIYGVEVNIVDDKEDIIKNYVDNDYDNFVVFDVETTGFSSRNDKIIEIGAVKIKCDKIVDSFNTFVNPERSLPEEIVSLTGINDGMLVNERTIDQILPDFDEFTKDSILVAHNASFDIGFLKYNYEKNHMDFNHPYIDTLEISRILYPNVRSHALGKIAKRLGVSLENAHRAVDDARATGEIFLEFFKNDLVDDFSISLKNIEKLKEQRPKHLGNTYHAIILAKNLKGLKNLYKLVSKSHMDYFYYRPRLPKSVIDEHREGLLLGSACQDGELFQAILMNEPEDKIQEIGTYYDYFEVQPDKNNLNLIPDYLSSKEEIQAINKEIIALGDKLGKLTVASGDVHYMDKDMTKARQILLASSRNVRKDSYNNEYSFLTTHEMLEEFSYLGDRAYELVVDNSKKIASQIEQIQPIPEGNFPPEIPGSDEELKETTFKRVYEIYGKDLPVQVSERIDKELDAIISNGYSVLYIISKKLVDKSNEDGYQVGSRGSVGSSLVAYLCGITEVNPLTPHYVCPDCHETIFIDMEEMDVYSGVDLPDKKCSHCGEKMDRLGEDCPFEVFLGFSGNKEPDIDLNFAGEYQAKAHKYTEELFGSDKVFRAGTIGTIAEKTAYGYVQKYKEESGELISKAESERLAGLLEGVKRTTGQHAGGLIVVPDDKDIYDFTPIQYPANDSKSGIITTHYDYHSIEENLLKLDILGHDVPSMIKMLEDLTGTDVMSVALNDEKTLSIFNSTDAFDQDPSIFESKVGTLGIPEFGTPFVMGMLEKTKPDKFSELVQICGLAHGTDVWLNNAEELVDSGQASLKDVISTREDIMNDLINAGADKEFAFYTMERVRKGKTLTDEEEDYISKLDLPDWYIDSLNKISYMFPKAHAVAYVAMSVRLAYYKVYYSDAFYATYLSSKLSNYDCETVIQGPEAIKGKISYIQENREEVSNKELNDIPIYQLCLEALSRGCKFGSVDLYKSEANKFTIEDGVIIPPFRVAGNLGDEVASSIVEEREKSDFLSIEDLMKRTQLSKTAVENLKSFGTLSGMSDSNQLSFF